SPLYIAFILKDRKIGNSLAKYNKITELKFLYEHGYPFTPVLPLYAICDNHYELFNWLISLKECTFDRANISFNITDQKTIKLESICSRGECKNLTSCTMLLNW